MKPTYLLTLTSSQRMALVSILGEAMANGHTYVDCSQDPTVETRAADLFQLVVGLDPVETLQTAPSAPQELEQRMSDTPRTDAKESDASQWGQESKQMAVSSDFARELERENARLSDMADDLLAHLDDGTHEPGGECSVCSVICCPHRDPLHLHHDGCPACARESHRKHTYI